MQPTELTAWRNRWERAGVPTIPLQAGTKDPFQSAWSARSSADMWHEAGPGFRGNIGTVMGNGNAVIDCDAPKTRQTVEALFNSVGIDPVHLPVVLTATPGHCQYYIRVTNIPDGGNWRKLPSQETGPGELRFGPGAQCAAPCSVVNGQRYHFERGGPESIPGLRAIRWRDLERLLGTQAEQPAVTSSAVTGSLTQPPIPLLHRDMPQRARWLLDYLRTALPHQPVSILDLDRKVIRLYESRSEAETAVTAMLILAGWTLADVAREFECSQPGHWSEQPNRDRCLRREYQHALEVLAASLNRRVIAKLYWHAAAMPWPGRTALTDRAVYLGLLTVAWQWDTWQPCAAQRDLAEYAATKRQTVARALERLQAAGMVELAELPNRTASIGTRWDLSQWALATVDNVASGDHKSHIKREEAGRHSVAAEVWARVGRSAGAVWRLLGDEPVSVGVLAERTGKHRTTVWRALGRLKGWDLAEQVEGGWVRSARTLQSVADEIGAAGRARRRHQEHERQRLAWRERVAGLGGGGALEIEPADEVPADVVPLNPAWPWGMDR